MRSIGGFIGLEAIEPFNTGHYHKDIVLSSGRCCFALILNKLKPKKIYIPYYICSSIASIACNSKVSIVNYNINKEFEVTNLPHKLKTDELFLFVNYFGLKNIYIKNLKKLFAERLIIDNTQSFFYKNFGDEIAFNSARKFFGVPDGAYLHNNFKLDFINLEATKVDYSYLTNRANGLEELSYKQFLHHESTMTSTIKKASNFSLNILNKINYEDISHKRRFNFSYLNEKLGKYNDLKLSLDEDNVPLYYPFLCNLKKLKQTLLREKIFIPTLWTDLLYFKDFEYSFENFLLNNLCPLPIDQRYSQEEMNRIISIIIREFSYE